MSSPFRETSLILECPKCETLNYLDPFTFWNFKGKIKCAGCDVVYEYELKNAHRQGPPKETKGRGTPVMGSRLRTAPTLTKPWTANRSTSSFFLLHRRTPPGRISKRWLAFLAFSATVIFVNSFGRLRPASKFMKCFCPKKRNFTKVFI